MKCFYMEGHAGDGKVCVVLSEISGITWDKERSLQIYLKGNPDAIGITSTKSEEFYHLIKEALKACE